MKRLFLFGLTIAAVGCAARPVAAPETGRALTFANVRSYFSDTLKFRPTEVQERCVIFYEGEWEPKIFSASCTVKNMRAGSGSAGSGSTSAIGNRNTHRSS